MLRSVSILVSVLIVTSTACSDRSTPLAPRAANTARMHSMGASDIRMQYIPILDTTSPAAMNTWGEIVGSIQLPNGQSAAFRWQGSRGLRVLTMPAGVSTSAVGVNDSGQVAIDIKTDTSESAAIWGWFGDVRVLRDLSTYRTASASPSCSPFGITYGGIVGGNCVVLGQLPVPTVWTHFGTPDALHVGGGPAITYGYGAGISNAGYVAGNMSQELLPDSNPLQMAFLFTPDKQKIVLPPAPEASFVFVETLYTRAHAVNDSGLVAGEIFGGDIYRCFNGAAVWTDHGTVVHDLGGCGYAIGVTNDSIAVGIRTERNEIYQYAVIWPQLGPPVDLPNNAGASVITFNGARQILGTIPGGPRGYRIVLWTLPPK
jgi:hypothetical protein